MYVLLTDDSGYHTKFQEKLAKALAPFSSEPLPDATPETMGYGHRVYGPYRTYDEGKCAAIRLPYDADYWVMEVEGL
jgi:hypothetical protein